MLTPASGPIVGGVVGGVLGLALLGLIAFVLVRKRKQKSNTAPSEKFADPYAVGQSYGSGPQDGGYPMQQPYNTGHYTPVPVSQPGVYDQNPGVYDQNPGGYVQPYAVPDTPGTGYRPYDPKCVLPAGRDRI
jgi:LPXTG-motif cell wall-anchored protein